MTERPYIKLKDTAKAAASIYKNNDFEGFTQLGGFFDPKNDDRLGWNKEGDAGGGSGGIYKFNNAPNQYILAFRGSKGRKDWVVDDMQIARRSSVDRASNCIDYAKQLQAQYPNSFILVVGHSLGGFLAQLVGVECDLPFITYNAPPAGHALKGHNLQKFKQGVNMRINWDPVSRAPGRHVGPLITMPHVGNKIHDAHTNGAIEKSMAQADYRENAAMAFITRNNP